MTQLVPDAPVNLRNNAELTNAFSIALLWDNGASDGGTAVLDYRVVVELESGDLIVDEFIIPQAYQTSDSFELTPGALYTFKVQSRNSVGYSLFSDVVTVRAARVPDPPENVLTTTVESTNVVVTWTAPYDGGSEILSYHIQVQLNDGSLYDDSLCDGTDPTVFAALECTIPITKLKGEPYNHPWGAGIYVKIAAINIVGSSAYTDLTNGAIILTTPSAPQNLIENPTLTNKNQIGLQWSLVEEDGGTNILDYRIWYDNGIAGNYIVLTIGWETTSYTAISLQEGIVYTFYVQARNSEGYGEISNTLSVLAAQPPSQPDPPQTVWTHDMVHILWTEPATNGAAISSYTIYIRTSDEITYATELTMCDGSNQDIIDTQVCSIHVSYLITEPFNLPWGSMVWAKVVATNIKGDSVESEPGTGATIITNPDPPVNLVEV